MSFHNSDSELTLYLVWTKRVGGDRLEHIYQNENEAQAKKNQLKKKGFQKVWVQIAYIKKEKPIFKDD